MKIAQIRSTIDAAFGFAQSARGARADEFKADRTLVARANSHLAALQSLEIAARFTDEIASRASAIAKVEAAAVRWYEANAKAPAANAPVF